MSNRISSEQFVVVYMQRGGDLGSIASDLGVTRASVYQRLTKMRKAGVKLPLKRKGTGYDIKKLNNLIREYKTNE